MSASVDAGIAVGDCHEGEYSTVAYTERLEEVIATHWLYRFCLGFAAWNKAIWWAYIVQMWPVPSIVSANHRPRDKLRRAALHPISLRLLCSQLKPRQYAVVVDVTIGLLITIFTLT